VSARRGKLVPLDAVTVAHYYTRVSSYDQKKDGLSLAQQPVRCLEYIDRQPRTIVGEHFEDVLTGKRDDRQDYQRMLMTIRGMSMQGKRQILVIPAFDRFGRNTGERLRAYEEFEKLGVALHGISEGGVVSKFIYTIHAAVAEEEVRRLGERVHDIIEGLAKDGWPKPGKPAWGFAWRAATDEERAAKAPKRVLELHEIEAEYVMEAWARYAKGDSIRSIAIWAGSLPAAARGGRNLGFNAIRQMFRAPIYVGRLGSYDDDAPESILDRPTARVPRMVDDELWSRAVLARATAQRVPRQASGEYRLTGLLYCWKCGSRMSGRHKPAQSGYKKADRYEYICNSGKTLGADQDGRRCSSTVLLDQIEGYVISLVRDVLEHASRAEGRAGLTLAWERLNQSERPGSAAGRLARISREREQTAASQIKASRRFVDGELSREQYDPLYVSLQAELDALDAELTRLRGMSRPTQLPMALEPLLRSLTGWRNKLDSPDVPLVRDALAVLLERVTPVRVRRGEYTAELEWTALGVWLLGTAAAVSNHENLVSVYHMAKARWSTETIDAPDQAVSA
jgi:DNA invertase Pin-like site-specific DNA recombinase